MSVSRVEDKLQSLWAGQSGRIFQSDLWHRQTHGLQGRLGSDQVGCCPWWLFWRVVPVRALHRFPRGIPPRGLFLNCLAKAHYGRWSRQPAWHLSRRSEHGRDWCRDVPGYWCHDRVQTQGGIDLRGPAFFDPVDLQLAIWFRDLRNQLCWGAHTRGFLWSTLQLLLPAPSDLDEAVGGSR